MEETNDTTFKDYFSQFPNIKQLVGPLISYGSLILKAHRLRNPMSQVNPRSQRSPRSLGSPKGPWSLGSPKGSRSLGSPKGPRSLGSPKGPRSPPEKVLKGQVCVRGGRMPVGRRMPHSHHSGSVNANFSLVRQVFRRIPILEIKIG